MLHYEMKNTFKNSCLQKKSCEEGSVCELCASFIKLISVIIQQAAEEKKWYNLVQVHVHNSKHISYQ